MVDNSTDPRSKAATGHTLRHQGQGRLTSRGQISQRTLTHLQTPQDGLVAASPELASQKA